MKPKALILPMVAIVVAATILPAAAAPLASPCTPGAVYDPGCDVDHNGIIDILDIQLTSGHWNQSGGFPLDAYWSVTGNSGTLPGTNYLGTSDNQALEVKVNGQRALRIEPSGTSPNLIGGYAGNLRASGAVGATIAGGGTASSVNQVTDNYGFIGGGENNQAGNNSGTLFDAAWATVSGGYGNLATGLYATVGGGYNNDVSASYGTVAGGGPSVPGNFTTRNRVTDNYGTVGGGGGNQAGDAAGTISDRQYATVSGGRQNIASASYSTISGGEANSAAGADATIGGGYDNTANGIGATVPGGLHNNAGGLSAFAAGQNATANHNGSFIWNDTHFASNSSTTSNEFRVNAQNGVWVIAEANNRAAMRAENLGSGDGIFAQIADGNYAGVFLDNIFVGGSCTGCTLVHVARNSGDSILEAGDIVAAGGIDNPLTGTATPVPLVARASSKSTAVVGIVQGRAELILDDSGSSGWQKPVQAGGAIRPGDYLFVVVHGLALVKVDSAAGPVAANQRLTVADNAGQARSLRSQEIAGMVVNEGAPVIGVALQDAGEGRVWALINPQ